MPTWSSCKKQNSSWRQSLLRNLMLPWSRKTCPKWNASSRSSPCWACMMRGWVTSLDTFASRCAPFRSGGNSNTYAPEWVSGFCVLFQSCGGTSGRDLVALLFLLIRALSAEDKWKLVSFEEPSKTAYYSLISFGFNFTPGAFAVL